MATTVAAEITKVNQQFITPDERGKGMTVVSNGNTIGGMIRIRATKFDADNKIVSSMTRIVDPKTGDIVSEEIVNTPTSPPSTSSPSNSPTSSPPSSSPNQSQSNNQTGSNSNLNSVLIPQNNEKEIDTGDKVQIIDNAIDVTNGNRAKADVKYGQGGPLWGTIERIDQDWDTGSRWELPRKVTKVRVKDEKSDVIVWQVQPKDIAPNVIHSSKPDLLQTESSPPPTVLPQTTQGAQDLSSEDSTPSVQTTQESRAPYATGVESDSWVEGFNTSRNTTGKLGKGQAKPIHSTKQIIEGSRMGETSKGIYENPAGIGWRYLNIDEKRNIGGPPGLLINDSIVKLSRNDAFDDPNKRRELLNAIQGDIQNSEGFPKLIRPANGYRTAEYDYRIDIGDSNSQYELMRGLEDRLMQARAAFGIPVHGDNTMAKAMKFYMYNRFRTPDTNLAHNKSVTYVFFTRPDLNLLKYSGGITAKNHILNHTETAMLWRRNPELFKLLTDRSRCNDPDNFNLLLSNQCTSFDVIDETLSTSEAGKSWNEYEMAYGNAYSARSAGEFSCNFTETSNYDVINLIKLWMTYIDMVSRGAWSPSYDLLEQNRSKPEIGDSYVYTKTLDYGASAYMFKCGPDGQDILYWSKYFGIFPINTGASALSWDDSIPIGTTPKLNIRFRYSFKRDLNPVSLIEFNKASNIQSVQDAVSEDSFNPEYGHSNRPYVGAPFVEMLLRQPKSMKSSGGVNRGPDAANSVLRLKFKKESDRYLTDELIYRNGLAGRSINNEGNSNMRGGSFIL